MGTPPPGCVVLPGEEGFDVVDWRDPQLLEFLRFRIRGGFQEVADAAPLVFERLKLADSDFVDAGLQEIFAMPIFVARIEKVESLFGDSMHIPGMEDEIFW
jgi:hypothetical protein